MTLQMMIQNKYVLQLVLQMTALRLDQYVKIW